MFRLGKKQRIPPLFLHGGTVMLTVRAYPVHTRTVMQRLASADVPFQFLYRVVPKTLFITVSGVEAEYRRYSLPPSLACLMMENNPSFVAKNLYFPRIGNIIDGWVCMGSVPVATFARAPLQLPIPDYADVVVNAFWNSTFTDFRTYPERVPGHSRNLLEYTLSHNPYISKSGIVASMNYFEEVAPLIANAMGCKNEVEP